MLKIRFFRKGRKKQPFYKIVVTDKNNPPSGGRFVEDVGFYNPLTKECEVKGDRVAYWTEKGAQPSDVVRNLLIKKGLIKGKKVNVVSISKKRKEKIAGKKEKEIPVVEKAQEMKEVVEEIIEEKREDSLQDDTPVEEKTDKKEDEKKVEETVEEEIAEKESEEKSDDKKEAEEPAKKEEKLEEVEKAEDPVEEGEKEEKSPKKEEK